MSRHAAPIIPAAAILGIMALMITAIPVHAAPAAISVTERPNPEDGPTRVLVTVYVIDVIEVDDASQSFEADLFFRLAWQDPRLADPASTAERVFPLGDVWHPQVSILNGRDLTVQEPNVVRVDPAGTVVFRQRTYGKLSSPLNLREFPRDQQVLPIVVFSLYYGTDDVTFVFDQTRSGMMDQFSAAGWFFSRGDTDETPLRIESVSQERARAVFNIRAERDTRFYVYTIFLPLLLIVLMAWSVFWIDPSLLPSQLGVSTASIFTMIAFRLSIRLMLPPVSYITRADIFLLSATFLVFFAFGEAVLTGALAKSGRSELAQAIDRWARWVYLAALALVIVVGLST
jgi:hypothetical protein